MSDTAANLGGGAGFLERYFRSTSMERRSAGTRRPA